MRSFLEHLNAFTTNCYVMGIDPPESITVTPKAFDQICYQVFRSFGNPTLEDYHAGILEFYLQTGPITVYRGEW